MVVGFEDPPGDSGALDRAAADLLSIKADLVTESTTVQNGFEQALEDWHAKRAEGFRAAGTGVTKSLNVGSGLLEGAGAALGVYAGALRQATDDIADLRRQAEAAESADTGDGADTGSGGTDSAAKVAKLREEADRIRRELKTKAGEAAGAMGTAVGKLVPGGDHLSPEEIARRVSAASGVDEARKALAQNRLRVDDAWKALGGDPSQENPLEKFFDTWGGFKPPSADNPVDRTLYALGLLGMAAGPLSDWMLKVSHGRFAPRGPSGGFTKIAGMSFFERLKAGAGRFPTGSGLTKWQRLGGFSKDGNFVAKGWRGAQYARWAKAGKWLGRAGTVVTAATAGWEEWQDSAGYPTDVRIGRTATKAATTAAGAWAGAEVGAWAGGAIGTAICPGVGTVIGAGLGALIGGFAGSELGGWVGDQVKGVVGDVADKVGDAVDKLKFW